MDAAHDYPEIAKRCMISVAEVRLICSTHDYTNAVSIFELLSARKHRTEFRQIMDNKVRKWLAESEPRLKSKPLSPKELVAIAVKWKTRSRY